MAKKKELTFKLVFNMTEKELVAIADLCREQDLNQDQVMRQALRLYQSVIKGAVKVVSGHTVGCGSGD